MTRRRIPAAMAVGVVMAALVAAACVPTPGAPSLEPGDGPQPLPSAGDRSWPMHLIDGRFRGANALGPADLNGDGQQDYVTMYEFDQRYVVNLHPGAGADPRAPWPTVDVWAPPARDPLLGVNPESAAMGDVDGDGNIDVVGAQGESQVVFWEGNSPGIRVFFGPTAAEVGVAEFVDAGRVPATTGPGHLHWVVVRDIDGDGLDDIVAGGREDPNGATSGIFWIEVPDDPALRRDLSTWQVHPIDPATPSGHGFTFADLDGDGDDDIVDANADFDTAEDEERLVWYENPGTGTAAQRQPWPVHELIREPIFHTKPQIATGDLDGDGDIDLATQTELAVEVLLNDGAAAPAFQRVTVPKPPEVQSLSRTIRMADLDGDGHQDLVGFLVHDSGSLPASKTAVYWMEWNGASPSTDWDWHTVRNGSGRTMLIPEFGEKWDQAHVVDVDGDGDLDIVANCEEWWTEPNGEWWPWFFDGVAPQSQAVVWFENTLDEAAPVVEESSGGGGAGPVVVEPVVIEPVVIEAEEPTDVADGVWAQRGTYGGWSGTGYLQAFNGLNESADLDLPPADIAAGVVGPTSSPGVRFDVDLLGGGYQVWVRRWVPQVFGYGQGGPLSDSAWLSIDGGESVVADDSAGVPTESWQWVAVGDPVALGPGRHELVLRVRERGWAVDQLVLAPSGWLPPVGAA